MNGHPALLPRPGSRADGLLAGAALTRMTALRHGLGEGPVSHGLTAAVVVARLEVPSFLTGAAEFALGLPPAQADGWYRTFTRTVFLSGRPAALAARHPHRHATSTGDLAWYGPARRGRLQPLSRLLHTFEAPAPIAVSEEPLLLTVPGPATHRTVTAVLATRRVSTAAYLVHAHHLITEAALRGLIRSGDTLRLAHRPDLHPEAFREALDPSRAAVVHTRVAPVSTDPHRLRLYGVLSPEHPEGEH
ncbi:DUF6182 family protein [Streptomyces griseorubiginosus]|uniref:DUF6182 family protein n=1 Tax=Streptomyces griseorubiginosus TaxID=67304 RepID=UPI0033B72DB5